MIAYSKLAWHAYTFVVVYEQRSLAECNEETFS